MKKVVQYSRVDNWPARLNEFIEATRFTPFQWGKNDCCLFAANAVLAVTGSDPAASYRKSYQNSLQGAKLAKKSGGVASLIAETCTKAGFKAVGVSYAGRGDVVTAKVGSNGSTCAGVCLGSHSAFPAESGLTFYPTSICTRVWRVA